MNTGIQDAIALAAVLVPALDGNVEALKAYENQRRPIATGVIALADRLTRIATVPRIFTPIRNLAIRALGSSSTFRYKMALQLAGLTEEHTRRQSTAPAGSPWRA